VRDGWQKKALGEVLEKTETVDPLKSPGEEFRYIDVSSVSNTSFRIEATQRLRGKDAPSRARKVVRRNDVLFATVRPTLRRIALVPAELDGQVCSTGYFVLRPKPGIDPGFVFYSLLTEDFMGQMAILQKGSSYPAVTDREVKAQKLAFPSFPEQQRIVAILDDAFQRIATVAVSAEKNLLDARKVFLAYLDSVFLNKPEWDGGPLCDMAEFRNGINYTIGSSGDTVAVIGVADFQDNFWIPTANLKTATIDDKLSDLDKLREGDLLVVRSNGNPELVGRSMVARAPGCETTHSGFTIRVRLRDAQVLPVYLAYFMRSGSTRRKMIAGGSGMSIRSLNQAMLSSLLVPKPSLDEQRQIVANLDALDRETRRLESLYKRKLAALDELKKSLLHEAFSGNL
jgi:type I restriction enzyme S subunit